MKKKFNNNVWLFYFDNSNQTKHEISDYKALNHKWNMPEDPSLVKRRSWNNLWSFAIENWGRIFYREVSGKKVE